MIPHKKKRWRSNVKRSLLLVLVGGLALPLTARPGEEDNKDWKPIRITWHGHSFFEVTSSKGTNIVLDPHAILAYGRVLGVKAAAITMSHLHNDHTQISVIENFQDKNIKIIPGLKGKGWNIVDEKVNDVHIRSVGLYHDSEQGMKYGKNAAFILEMDGWRIVHLGDLGHTLTADQVKKIGRVDVLMIPVGGIYTINGAEAKKVVEQLKPREYIFPMHFGTKVFNDVLPADEFLEDQPRAQVSSSLDNFVVLNRDPQRPRPLIVLLHYWPRKKD
jgi:L-ascorbate metabolism protein UlaG (beta-lactamase superfamily)